MLIRHDTDLFCSSMAKKGWSGQSLFVLWEEAERKLVVGLGKNFKNVNGVSPPHRVQTGEIRRNRAKLVLAICLQSLILQGAVRLAGRMRGQDESRWSFACNSTLPQTNMEAPRGRLGFICRGLLGASMLV